MTAHVEFFGSPGSGKSTVTRLLSDSRPGGRRICTSAEEAFLLLHAELVHPAVRRAIRVLPPELRSGILRRLLPVEALVDRSVTEYSWKNRRLVESLERSETLRHLPEADRNLVLGSFLRAAAVRHALGRCPAEHLPVLYDEGLVQKSMMFLSFEEAIGSGKQELDPYLESIPAADLYIHFHPGTASCRSRMEERPKGLTVRMKSRREEEILRFLERSEAHFAAASARLRSLGRVVVEIANEGSPDDARRRIALELTTRFPAAEAPPR